jgi:hypothetical protein
MAVRPEGRESPVEEEATQRPLTNHLRAIQRFKGSIFKPLRIWSLQSKLDQNRAWTIAELLPVLGDNGFTRSEFFSLVLNRHLCVDLRRPIGLLARNFSGQLFEHGFYDIGANDHHKSSIGVSNGLRTGERAIDGRLETSLGIFAGNERSQTELRRVEDCYLP